MRVLFNRSSTLGARTGIGHCAQSLLDELDIRSDLDVSAFPFARWMKWDDRIRRIHQYLLAFKKSLKPSRALLPFASLRGLLASAYGKARQVYARCIELLHRDAFFGSRFDLYHEPNFIPLESSLPTVTTIHDLSVLRHPEWHPQTRVNWFTKNFPRAMSQSAHFITVSQFTRREMIRHLGVSPNRVTYVPNAAREHFRPEPLNKVHEMLHRHGLPQNYLLYVGTIEPRKNILRLMKAYCSLDAGLRERWPLLLVGCWGWNYREELNYYESTGRHRGVRHVGYISDADLPLLYNGARALIYPSYYEGFGLPPLEMLACGGAVLASNLESIAEVVGKQAHLVAPEDTDGWRDAIKRITTSEDWWQHLRRGAVEQALRFSWQNIAAQTSDVYRRVLEIGTPAFVAPMRIAA